MKPYVISFNKLFFIALSLQIILIASPISSQTTLSEFQWNAVGEGLNGDVNEIVINGTDVYAGGYFTDAGGDLQADYLARWDGQKWNAVIPALNGPVHAIAIHGNDVYVGGSFALPDPNARNILRWDGSSVHALGEGLNQSVFEIAVHNDKIYVGGSFTDAGGNNDADHIAQWNGNTWQALGSGMVAFNNGVWTIAFDENNLYAGGDFMSAGGVPNTRGIARWDGNNWNALDQGFWGDMGVLSIAIDGSDVFAGGDGGPLGTTMCGIGRWDGNTWNSLGSGLSNCLYGEGAWHIETNNGDTYVGGLFNNTGIENTASLAKWNGNEWSSLGTPDIDTGFNAESVYAIATSGDDVYIGGTFANVDGVAQTSFIARWGEPNITAIDDPSLDSKQFVNVFPNPANETIQYSNVHPGLVPHKVFITDIQGRSLLSRIPDSSSVDISQLPSGLYYLKLQTDDGMVVGRFIKM